MLVTLIGKEQLFSVVLPQNKVGSYWIYDNTSEIEKKLVNIEGKNGEWQILTNRNLKIINPRSIKIDANEVKIQQGEEIILDRIVLKEYELYPITIGGIESILYIYVTPAYEKELHQIEIKDQKEFYIGSGNKNQIIYKNAFVSDTHTRIVKDGANWILENIDRRIGTYVNNKLIYDKTINLQNGDIIFIMGLKIIMMRNTLFINNPLKNILYNNHIFKEIKNENNKLDITVDYDEDDDTEIFSENEYFSRAPRITNLIKKEKIKIDPPPQAENREETPAILVVGSTLLMGLMMILSSGRAIVGSLNGTATPIEFALEILLAIIMLFAMILIPILNIKYEKNRKIKHEEKRQKRYKKYIESKIDFIDETMEKQRNILLTNYVSAEECKKIILNKDKRLWERKIEDKDFLNVRIGIGDVPLEVDINYPEESFMMDDDNLIDILHSITKKSKILNGAPIIQSLVEKNILAIISKDNKNLEKMIKNIIIQLVAFQSYDDLKIVFLVNEDKYNKWEFAKLLPHVWDNNNEIRFFADTYDEIERLSSYLEEDFKQRVKYEDADYKQFMPYYLIITDNYKKIENVKIIKQILDCKKNIGYSLICLTDDLMQLPTECKTFISLQEKTGKIFQSEMVENSEKDFTFILSEDFNFDNVGKNLFSIPIRYSAVGNKALPNSYSFLEMYDVGLIEHLNIKERWRKNDSTISLKAPVGIDSTGRIIYLDIHEKFHGPHGLIAGSTGSGKSEFIITYVLSLAINYHPDDVAFVLIDYKGGGLAGAFQKRDIKLPHLVGTITNIDKIGLQRSLASIQSELRRRQIAFNEARNMTDEGTIDIYKYQKLYHQGIVSKPIPHLLIICDEFAELKQQQEEFMEELISVSRIGRSLGVHLILATQKPAGVVNEQIRSNSRFGICLKVQTKEDSQDVINKPDAVNLKGQGQFYIQVGNDEYFALGQSAWTGANYVPSNVVKKKVDNTISFVSNLGDTIKQVGEKIQKKVNSEGEQLTKILKHIDDIAKEEKIESKKLWLENIPETIMVQDLRKKYNIKNENNIIAPIIGEFDDPNNQRQNIKQLNLLQDGNTIIYGNADSGKETLLSTIVYDTIVNHSPDEVWIYLLDFGSEALKIYKGAPHVGDVVFINEDEKIGRFLDMISNIIKERKTILSNYNGDYNLYLEQSDKPMPLIIVVMNNYASFLELYEYKYDDMLLTLTREGPNYGIEFVFSVNAYSDMRYRLTQNFRQKIALQLNNDDDYYNIFEKVGKKRPSKLFGRGLISNDGEIFEFQTAKFCKPEEYNVFVNNKITELNKKYTSSAGVIPTLPNKILIEDIKKYVKNISKLPIGLSKNNLKIYEYNFKNNFISIITSRNINEAGKFSINLIEEIRMLKDVEITIFDTEKIISSKKMDISGEYQNFVLNVYNNNSKLHNICFIIGLDKFLNEIQNEDTPFSTLLKQAEENENCSFIIVDSVTKIKDIEYESWFKEYVSKENGIWVGNGFEDQYFFTLLTRNNIINNPGNSFGYAVKSGEATQIKLVGMKDKGDEDE